jgi:hypothetical protein
LPGTSIVPLGLRVFARAVLGTLGSFDGRAGGRWGDEFYVRRTGLEGLGHGKGKKAFAMRTWVLEHGGTTETSLKDANGGEDEPWANLDETGLGRT